MTKAKINEPMLEDFAGQIIETVWYTGNSPNGDIVRLIVVAYPLNDMLQYRIEFYRDSIQIYTKFSDALRTFKGLI